MLGSKDRNNFISYVSLHIIHVGKICKSLGWGEETGIELHR